MAINAKVDSVVYKGIEKISAGGKTVELSEVYSGSKVITENGTYNIAGKNEVVVNVPTEGSGGSLDVYIEGETIIFTENSTASVANETLVL